MQLVNSKLQRQVQELERKTKFLMINLKEQKIGNNNHEMLKFTYQKQNSSNSRVEGKQLLQKLLMNDIMDVEWKVPTAHSLDRKIMRLVQQAISTKSKKLLPIQRQKGYKEKQCENIFLSIALKKEKFKGKKYSNQTKKLQMISMQLINSIRNTKQSTQQNTQKKQNKNPEEL